MIMNFYLFCTNMKHMILNNFHATLIVIKGHIRFIIKILIFSYNLHNQIHSLAPLVRARYSTFVEEITIVGYFFKHHVTTLIPILNMYLVVECQLSLFPTQFALICPSSKLLDPFSYNIPKFVTPFTYLKLCF